MAAGFTSSIASGLFNQVFGNSKTLHLVLLTVLPSSYTTCGREVRDNTWPYARKAVTFTCSPTGIQNNEAASWAYLSNVGTFGTVVGVGVIEELSSDLSNLLAFTVISPSINFDGIGSGDTLTISAGDFKLQIAEGS